MITISMAASFIRSRARVIPRSLKEPSLGRPNLKAIHREVEEPSWPPIEEGHRLLHYPDAQRQLSRTFRSSRMSEQLQFRFILRHGLDDFQKYFIDSTAAETGSALVLGKPSCGDKWDFSKSSAFDP